MLCFLQKLLNLLMNEIKGDNLILHVGIVSFASCWCSFLLQTQDGEQRGTVPMRNESFPSPTRVLVQKKRFV